MKPPSSAVVKIFAIMIFVTSCSHIRWSTQEWEVRERLALGREQKGKIEDSTTGIEVSTIEKLISVPMDHKKPFHRKFKLYYFVRMPVSGRAEKNILFFAGGPGQIVSRPLLGSTFADFLTENGYNVVFFHQRGAGFSQIPASNQFDKYLKTSYVVEDVEAIRQDFLGQDGNWDAIIGWSYGTIVAQQYAHFHAAKVNKVILIGPESRDMFKNSPDAFDKLTEAVRVIDRQTLRNIFDLNLSDFPKLNCSDPKCDELKTTIIDTAFGTKENPGVYDRAVKLFGSIPWLVDFYCEPETQKELINSGLDRYSPEFFNRLRLLRMFGWLRESIHNEVQINGARTIADQILSGDTHRCTTRDVQEPPDSSQRVFRAVGVYDGINSRFLNQWIQNGRRIREALRESEGDAHLNGLEKVGIGDSASLTPWDPADYRHNGTTLILKGGADSVSAAGQAERFYLGGLYGNRTLIEFRGVGHGFGLPEIPLLERPLLTGTVRVVPPPIEPGETRSVLGTYSGRTLDENFRLKLEGSSLEPSLKLTGLGILKNAEGGDNGKRDPRMVALIENTGDSSVNGERRKWTLSNNLFRGGVSLDPPPIDRGKTAEVQGTIEDTRPDHVIHFTKPDDLEKDLHIICVSVVGVTAPGTTEETKLLFFWFQNNSRDRIVGKRRPWLVSNGRFSGTVSFEPGPIEPRKVVQKSARLPSGFEIDTELSPIGTLDFGLKGCLAPKQSSNEDTYIAIVNTISKPVNGANLKWQIKNPMAKWTVEVDPPEFQQRGDGDKVTARDVKVEEWNERPTLNKPTNWEPTLELRGYNLERGDKVSVLLRNNSKTSLFNSAARDWVYVDPNESDKSACLKRTTALDCLIYSFLVMGTESFNNELDNKIIGIVKRFGATLRCRYGSARLPRPDEEDACP